MSSVERLHLLTCPLEGMNLIEASAGTGKTFTIAGLFLRLVLESCLAVHEILVVTFTEAATGELQERVRRRLREAAAAFARGSSEDPFLQMLLERSRDRAADSRRLAEALRGFDQAAITTIHGFCRRMLREHAFESGELFDTELIPDDGEFRAEIAADYWRRHLYPASPLFVNYALKHGFTVPELQSLPAGRPAQKLMRILPEIPHEDTSALEAAFASAFERAAQAWPAARPEVEELLTSDPGLNRTRYSRPRIPLWAAELTRCLSGKGWEPELCPGFEKFTSAALHAAARKGSEPLRHPFFELCDRLKQVREELLEAYRRRLLRLRAEFLPQALEELGRRKKDKGVQSFDDLLLGLHQALEGAGGERLVQAIRRKFGAALIDEFQDTDPVQYDIFRHLFGGGENALFLIGDPKQAIYGFRGADVFAYLQAAEEAPRRYTLTENWRAQAGLVTATNCLYGRHARPFVHRDIPFHQVTPAPGQPSAPLTIDGRPGPALQVWFLSGGEEDGNGRPLGKGVARERIAGAVACEISRLLALGRAGRAKLGERPVREADFAVLVRTHREAGIMWNALEDLRIPAVAHSTGSLFETHEALEMERILSAVTDPGRERAVRAAMATDMLGTGAGQLAALETDQEAWEERLSRFRESHDTWRLRGFIRMFRSLLLHEEVLPRLAALPDGERRATNVLHLAEVLQEAAVRGRLGMLELLGWLARQRGSRPSELEEHQLRLESDEERVRIVTVHKSKGLEYPVVFCPFLWGGSGFRNLSEPLLFHDAAEGRLTLDLGSERHGAHRELAERERLAENTRLLYVAMTRAKSCCTLVWGHFREAETSALAYLLHCPGGLGPAGGLGRLRERLEALGQKEMLAELDRAVKQAAGSIGLVKEPAEAGLTLAPGRPGERALSFRPFSGRIDRHWRVSSFSALTTRLPHGEELPDRDPELPQGAAGGLPAPEEPLSGAFALPRGTRLGNCLHAVLERLDFTDRDPARRAALVSTGLREHGLDPVWQPAICDMLGRVLAASLSPARPGLRLGGIPGSDRLNELEFYFPLQTVTPAELGRLFEDLLEEEPLKGFPQVLERLEFSPVRGFLKGFMDLVFFREGAFYLVDWKSNFLGGRAEDYARSSLARVMVREAYVLQYTLYTLALDQYLRLRLPGYDYERHFGGVFYVFLRGVDPDRGPGFGIFDARPSRRLIEKLRAGLMGVGE